MLPCGLDKLQRAWIFVDNMTRGNHTHQGMLVTDLSRLEIKKVTGEIEITGGKNLLLTVD